jgi:hypothetical protein
MDATLGARNPVAASTSETSASDTSTSPADPLAESEATTKRLPTAEELYAAPTERADARATAAADVTTGADAPETEILAAVGGPAGTDAPAPAPDTAAPGATGSAPVAGATGAAADASGTSAGLGADAAAPGVPGAPAPAAPDATAEGSPHPASGRTVSDLADRLDDSRFFSSLFDFTFTNYVTRKLAGPVYVVGLVLIALGVVVGFANALTSAIATHAPIGAFVFLFGVLITLVGAMLAVLLLRVGIEVFCAIIEIAQNTRRRRPPGE